MNSRTQFPFLFLTWEKSFKIPFHKNRHYLKREGLLQATLLPPEGGGREAPPGGPTPYPFIQNIFTNVASIYANLLEQNKAFA